MRYWRLITSLSFAILLGIVSFPALKAFAVPAEPAPQMLSSTPVTQEITVQENKEQEDGVQVSPVWQNEISATLFYTTIVSIPSYPYAPYLQQDLNSTYNITYPVLNWGAYEASHPEPAPQDYVLLVMENDYLTVTVMPALGGRVYQIIDKVTDDNYLYQNPVIKPTHWGPPEQGWWLAVGGIEWCLPVEEHGYEWGIPWHWDVVTSTAGVTVTVWDTNASDRFKVTLDLFLPADRAALRITPHLENPTDAAIDYKFWINAALAPGAANKPTEDLEFLFNADEMAIHSTGDDRLPGALPTVPTGPDYRISWPVYNYVDFSRLGNWHEWVGFFEYPQAAENFVGVYDHNQNAGMMRIFPRQVARGTKGFGYGWANSLPWSLWTDEDSGGVEVHGGVAPTFWDTAHLDAGTILSWTETWYPTRNIDGVSDATEEAMLYVFEEQDNVQVDVHTTLSRTADTSHLYIWDKITCVELAHWSLPAMTPLMPHSVTTTTGSRSLEQLAIAYVDQQGNVLASVNNVACMNVTPPSPHLGYGLNVRDYETVDDLVSPLDFEWVKLWEEYMWENHGSAMPQAPLSQKVLYLINCGGYVGNIIAWGDHVEQIAQEGRGIVNAYEICNETNVRTFWNNQSPDPAGFAEMLCVARDRIKAVDPAAVVVSGGLAPVGRVPGTCDGWEGNDCSAMDERLYLQGMLDHGAGACMDAFGYHPYGFAAAPEQGPQYIENGFAFRGAEVMHDILVDAGLTTMPVWATEFNWIRSPTEDGVYCDNDSDYVANFKWQEVSARLQADYLVRAFQYADTQWSWMEGMFVWNLDWHNYRAWLPCLHSRYYAIRRSDGSDLGAPTLAYDALASLIKRPGLVVEPRLVVQPTQHVFLVDLSAPKVLSAPFAMDNAGYGTFTWTAQVMPQSNFTPTLSITTGSPGEVLWITVDPTAVETPPFPGTTTMFWPGVFSSTIRITTTPTQVLGSPQYLTLTVQARPELGYAYLPLVTNKHTLAPAEPHGPSKIGLHAISDGGTVEFAQQVKEGGAHVAVVKGLSFGYLRDVKEISPETITIGRWSDYRWEAIQTGGDVREQAELYMDAHMERWEPHKAYVDYWEILNEVDPPTVEGHVWLAHFFSETMQIAEDNGYRLALFSYSMGVPEIYEWQAIAETGVFARAKQGGHILSLHEYANPMDARWGEAMPLYPGQDPNDPSLPRYPDRGVLTGRYRHLYRDILIPRGEVIPLVITECNLAIDDPDERAEIFVEEMSWYDDRLREDYYVIGMTIFTLGGQSSNWGHFDFRDFFPELAERIIALKDE